MTKKQGALTVTEESALPAFLVEAEKNAEVTGFENVDQSTMALSIINLLQSNSEALKSNEELRGGMFYDTATKNGYKELVVTLVGFVPCYIEWVPHNQGGGFVARYDINSGIDRKATAQGFKMFLPNGNELAYTFEYMVIVWPEEGDPYLAMFPLSGTQLGPAKTWNTEANRRGGLSYAQKYKLTTFLKRNDKGSWYMLNTEFCGYTNEAEFALTKQAAEDYARSLSKASAAYSSGNDVVDVASEDLSDMA